MENKHAPRLAKDLKNNKELNERCKKSARLDKQKWVKKKSEFGELYLLQECILGAFAHFRQLRFTCFHISSPILNAVRSLISDMVQKAAC